MREAYLLKEKVRQFFIIFLPIFITQFSLTAIGFFDAVMSGKASHFDLAGVAIGSNLWMPVFTGVGGVLAGITPVLAQLLGAGRKKEMPFVVVQSIYIAMALALVVVVGGWAAVSPLLNMMELEPPVHDIAYRFLAALSLGVLPLFVFSVLRNFIDALGYTRITMMITLCAVPVNIALNYLLILGHWGFPRLGGVGAGYASAITYWCLALIGFGVVHYVRPFAGYKVFSRFTAVSLTMWREILLLGLPIGLSIFCEVSIFGVVALLMAEYGTAVIAAHQAAINFAGLVYMLPLSIGMTLTIVVGFEVGARRYRDAWQYSKLGIGLAVAIAVFFAAGLFLFKGKIASLYTEQPAVLTLIEGFLVYAVFFQLSDAIAAPIQGALRGYKDVRVTFLTAVLSYWVIGMPSGYLLAKFTAFQAYGYWIGFIVGLAVGAVVLLLRLIGLQKRVMSGRRIS